MLSNRKRVTIECCFIPVSTREKKCAHWKSTNRYDLIWFHLYSTIHVKELAQASRRNSAHQSFGFSAFCFSQNLISVRYRMFNVHRSRSFQKIADHQDYICFTQSKKKCTSRNGPSRSVIGGIESRDGPKELLLFCCFGREVGIILTGYRLIHIGTLKNDGLLSCQSRPRESNTPKMRFRAHFNLTRSSNGITHERLRNSSR